MADSYSQYQDAAYSDDAVDLRGRTQMFMYISAGTGAAGIAAGVLGLTMGGGDPREKEINSQIELVKKQIVELRWLANKLEKEEAA